MPRLFLKLALAGKIKKRTRSRRTCFPGHADFGEVLTLPHVASESGSDDAEAELNPYHGQVNQPNSDLLLSSLIFTRCIWDSNLLLVLFNLTEADMEPLLLFAESKFWCWASPCCCKFFSSLSTPRSLLPSLFVNLLIDVITCNLLFQFLCYLLMLHLLICQFVDRCNCL